MVISLSGSEYLLLLICYYAVITQSEVAFLTETNNRRSHGMEIFVCKLTEDFMSGINLLQKRNITVKEPLDFTVILVTEKVI